MSTFRIVIKAGTPATFNPKSQTVFVNDTVFWFNSDTQAHWPAPSPTNKTGFLQYQIAPNSSSNTVSFGVPKKIPYVCVNHTGETGEIIVKSRKKKGAFGKKTKKGGFGRKTKKGAFGKKTKTP